MPQRINAARVLVNINMKNTTNESPGSEKRLRSKELGQTGHWLKPVSRPDSVFNYNSEPVSSSPDRRMSRRRPGNQGKKPLEYSQVRVALQQDTTTAEIQEDIPVRVPFNRGWIDQNYFSPDFSAAEVPPETVEFLPEPEAEEEPYYCDRPVFLLSQKYFGTRY